LVSVQLLFIVGFGGNVRKIIFISTNDEASNRLDFAGGFANLFA